MDKWWERQQLVPEPEDSGPMVPGPDSEPEIPSPLSESESFSSADLLHPATTTPQQYSPASIEQQYQRVMNDVEYINFYRKLNDQTPMKVRIEHQYWDSISGHWTPNIDREYNTKERYVMYYLKDNSWSEYYHFGDPEGTPIQSHFINKDAKSLNVYQFQFQMDLVHDFESGEEFVRRFLEEQKLTYNINLDDEIQLAYRGFDSHHESERSTSYAESSMGKIRDLHRLFEELENSQNTSAYDNKTVEAGENVDSYYFMIWLVLKPKGGDRTKALTMDTLYKKKSYIAIQNTDSLCLARAVIVASSQDHPKWEMIRKGKAIQRTMAVELCEKSGVSYMEKGKPKMLGLEDVQKFEKHLNVQISVLEGIDMKYIYKPDYQELPQLYVHKDGDHFNAITSMAPILGCRAFCHVCKKGYGSEHRCQSNLYCKECRGVHGPLTNTKRTVCKACNRSFPEPCFEIHLKKACKTHRFCVECNTVVRRINELGCPHHCGYRCCTSCKEEFPKNDKHLCYMRKCTMKEPSEKYIFFDTETQPTKPFKVNCVVAQYIKDTKIETEKFHSVEDFLTWLMGDHHKGYTCIAHNGKAFDFQLLMNKMLEMKFPMPKYIKNGQNLMCMSINGIRFVDSLNFLKMPLKDFTDTFGLTCKKGEFPYRFNTPEHEHYIGPYPGLEYFDLRKKKMEPVSKEKKSEYEEFMEWYAERSKSEFNLQKELFDYCIDDVTLLREGCMAFRSLIMEYMDADPWQYNTIASLCNAYYRANILEEKTIALIPPAVRDTFSFISCMWLDEVSERNHINIKHALNGGEQKIDARFDGYHYKVDGFDAEHNTVYEFYGCKFHGCPKCYPKRTEFVKCTGNTHEGNFEKTMKREDRLKRLGYKVVTMWEHDYQPAESQKKLRKHLLMDKLPLDPRDAFYGGRTNVLKMYHKGVFQYIDVCSLYPTVNFYDVYPMGHPIRVVAPTNYRPGVFTWEEGYMKSYIPGNYFGLVKCRVEAPRKLYHPVLPVKINGKLMFPLCVHCAEEKLPECPHPDRSFVGVWATPELDLALQFGYKLVQVYEIQHFDLKSNNLFKKYVAKFMRIKAEADGVPKGMAIEEYIRLNKEAYGFEMKPENIKYNKGKREFAKLMLNSFWGKFGQREDLKKHQLFDNQSDFFKGLMNPNWTERHLEIISKDVVEISYKEKSSAPSNNTNIYIAAFTTAWARIRLYMGLSFLGDRVLGHDTDSIWYIGEPVIETKKLLGWFSDEFLKDYGAGVTGDEWIGLGPKNYGYHVATEKGKIVVKVKGFCLDNEVKKQINLDTMREMVLDKTKKIDVNIPMIKKGKDFTLGNTSITKQYRFVYDKCRYEGVPDHGTLPWGY
jgi:hypothetical protein